MADPRQRVVNLYNKPTGEGPPAPPLSDLIQQLLNEGSGGMMGGMQPATGGSSVGFQGKQFNEFGDVRQGGLAPDPRAPVSQRILEGREFQHIFNTPEEREQFLQYQVQHPGAEPDLAGRPLGGGDTRDFSRLGQEPPPPSGSVDILNKLSDWRNTLIGAGRRILGPSAPNPDVEAKETLRSQRETAQEGLVQGSPISVSKQLGPAGASPTKIPYSGPRGGGGEDLNDKIALEQHKQVWLAQQAGYEGTRGTEEQVAARQQFAEEKANRMTAAEQAVNAAQKQAEEFAMKQREASEKYAKLKLDPQRLYNSLNDWQKFNFKVGAALGGALAGVNGGENTFITQWDRQVEQDLKAQQDQFEKQKYLASEYKGLYGQLRDLGMDREHAASTFNAMHAQLWNDKLKTMELNTSNEQEKLRLQSLQPAFRERVLTEKKKQMAMQAAAAEHAADKAWDRTYKLLQLNVEAGKQKGAGREREDKAAQDIRERSVAGPGGSAIIFNRKEDALKYNDRLDQLNGLDSALAELEAAQAESTRPGRILGKTGIKTEATRKYEAAGKRALLKWSHAEGGGALDKGLQAAGSDIGFEGGDIDLLNANPAAVKQMRKSIMRRKAELHNELGGQAAGRGVSEDTGLEEIQPGGPLLGPGYEVKKTPIGKLPEDEEGGYGGSPAPKDDARFGELGVLKRPDGDISTEISITVTDPRLNGGRPTNIPTLVRGQRGVDALLRGEEPTGDQESIAIQRAIERQRGGAYLPSYGSIDEAVSAAEERTAQKGKSVPLTRRP